MLRKGKERYTRIGVALVKVSDIKWELRQYLPVRSRRPSSIGLVYGHSSRAAHSVVG